MLAFYSDHFVLPLPADHKFPMAKYSRLRQRVLEHRILPAAAVREAPAASRDDLCRVHTPEYVDAVFTGTLPPAAQRRIGFPWSPEMVERSRRSVGATLAAVRAALDSGCGVNLAGGTHHAFRDRGEGFCVFNDIAVAAQQLRDTGRAVRILIVDCDVHQGNGTAAIFAGDPSVYTFSIHGASNFPFRKESSDLDVALADGTEDAEYLDRLESALETSFERADPDFVFYLSGADAYAGDRLGRLSLTIQGLRQRDALVLDRCSELTRPVAIAMGGGYAQDIDEIVTIHAGTIAEAAARWGQVPASAARGRYGATSP